MDRAIVCLENHDLTGALEAVYTISNSRYVFLLEEEVYTCLTEYVLSQSADRPKWGAGRIVRHQSLFGLAESLKTETVKENPDTREEYEVLVRMRESQFCCYEGNIRYVMASADKPLEAIRKAEQWILNIKKDSDTNKSKIREE